MIACFCVWISLYSISNVFVWFLGTATSSPLEEYSAGFDMAVSSVGANHRSPDPLYLIEASQLIGVWWVRPVNMSMTNMMHNMKNMKT